MGFSRSFQSNKKYGNGRKRNSEPTLPPSPNRFDIHPIQQLQKTIGNRAVIPLLQSENSRRSGTVRYGTDVYEREADHIADWVMDAPLRLFSAKSGSGARRRGKLQGKPLPGNVTRPVRAETESGGSPLSESLFATIERSLGKGRGLPSPPRRFMESRFGTDFSDVRVHTGGDAVKMNRETDSRAITVGNDIYFGAGRFQPESFDGGRLLAHELVHTLQQAPGRCIRDACDQTMIVQRNGEGSTEAPAITARTIIPFPQGSRIQLNRILEDNWFQMLSAFSPEIGPALSAIENQVGTVTTTNEDLCEIQATISQPIQLAAQGGRSAMTIRHVELRLQRSPSGTFDLVLGGRADLQSELTPLFARRNMTAQRQGEAIVLSSGGSDQLRISTGEAAGQVRIETFTAPYLERIPEFADSARQLVPRRLDLLQMTRLPDVQPGTADEQAAIEATASRVRARRRIRRQRLVGGAGILVGARVDPLLAVAWQISFTPVRSAGSIFQVPLEVQLQYSPAASVLAGISSGAELSLSQIRIPVNVRLVTGMAGGVLQTAAPEGSEERPITPAFGITVGAGAGLELRSFRLDLRYEHLFNLLEESPNADAVLLRLGGSF